MNGFRFKDRENYPDFQAWAKLPIFRYFKEPVDTVSELYEKYPMGAERFAFTFVESIKKMVFWDFQNKQWIELDGGHSTGNLEGSQNWNYF
ncbi:MAG: hypothetical protein LBJ17_05395 [Dysgonamonadaceae bacterium]|jgi:hypothetical protein|nr:hypothetical protein [Dysgonamonadaceae bacterium]